MCFPFNAADDRKRDHFVMSNFAVARGIHHNTFAVGGQGFFQALCHTTVSEFQIEFVKGRRSFLMPKT